MAELVNDFDPRGVLRRHWASVVGARLWYIGVPVAVGLGAFVGNIAVDPVREALFAGVAVLTAYYLYVTTQASARISEMAVAAPRPTDRTRAALDRQLDLIANGAYGVFIAIAALVTGGVSTWVRPETATEMAIDERVFSAVTYSLVVQLALTMLLVATRSFHDAEKDSNAIRSGAAATDREAAELDFTG